MATSISPALIRLLSIFGRKKSEDDTVSDLPGGGWNQDAADKSSSLNDIVSDLPGGGWRQDKADASVHGKQTVGSQKSSLDSIISDLLKPHVPGQAMQTYMEHTANMPQRQPRSGLAKVLAVISGGVGRLTDPNSSDRALGALDMPYTRQLQDWQLQGKNLANLADIEEKTTAGEDKNKMAAATLGLTEQARQTAQQKADEQARKDAAIEAERERQMNILQQRADQGDENARAQLAELKRHHAVMETKGDKPHQIWKEGHDESGAPTYEVLPDPNTLKPGTQMGGKLSGQGVEQVAGANAVLSNTARIRQALSDPKTAEELSNATGVAGGRWEKFVETLGTSNNPKARQLALDLHFLAQNHAKASGRSSVQMVKYFDSVLGNLEQDPTQMNATLDAVDANAHDVIKGHGVGKSTSNPNKKTITLKSGKTIEVEE